MSSIRTASAPGRTGPARPAGTVATTGTVLGLVGTRALVRTADGTTAHVAQELTLPTVPIDRLLSPGMGVRGALDPRTHRLDVRGALPDAAAQAARVLARYPTGAVVPVQVHRVHADEVTLALAPAVTVRVDRERAATGGDDLRDLFDVGEVVAARMRPPRPVPGPAGGCRRPALRLDDVDDDADVLPAISLLDGGPPWLPAPASARTSTPTTGLRPPATATASASQDRPAPVPGPRPGPGPQRAVPLPDRSAGHGAPPAAPAGAPAAPEASPSPDRKALVRQLELSVHEYRARAELAERENVELRASVSALGTEVDGLRDLVCDQRTDLDRLHRRVEQYKARLRSARKQRTPDPASATAPDRLFVDPEDQLRHDVYLTWAELVGADEKADHPLPGYAVGPRFCDSLAGPGRGFEDRVHRAVVLVLTGRAHDVAGYELHRLRRGDGGSDAHRVRESDGAQAMRLSLQVSAPQARRLHYWQLPGGGVELSRVVLHDDVDP